MGVRAAAGAAVLAVAAALLIVAAPAASAITSTITIGDNFFSPATATIALGDTAHWTNTGNNPHNVTSDNGAFTASTTLSHNGTFDLTPAAAGTFPYHCSIHGFTGTLIVVDAGEFHPLAPSRILDTRDTANPLGPDETRVVAVGGHGGVPADATAVVMNVTAVDTTAAGFLTVFPGGARPQTVSNLNFVPGQTVPNLVTVGLTAGNVSIYNLAGTTHLLLDVAGYFTAHASGNAGRFHAVAPVRLLDTRDAGSGGPVAAGSTRTFHITVPGVAAANVGAVTLNLTTTNGGGPGYLTAWPADAAQPTVSNVNFGSGSAAYVNRAIVKVSPTGDIDLFAGVNATNVIVDLSGWFSTSAVGGSSDGTSGVLTSVAPARLLDTRQGAGTPLGQGATLQLAVAGHGGVPANAAAVVLNVTGVDATQPTFLTVWPQTAPLPATSDVNPQSSAAVPNLVIVKLTAGGVQIQNAHGSTHVIADVFAWVS